MCSIIGVLGRAYPYFLREYLTKLLGRSESGQKRVRIWSEAGQNLVTKSSSYSYWVCYALSRSVLYLYMLNNSGRNLPGRHILHYLLIIYKLKIIEFFHPT